MLGQTRSKNWRSLSCIIRAVLGLMISVLGSHTSKPWRLPKHHHISNRTRLRAGYEDLEKVRMFRKAIKSIGERIACFKRDPSYTSDPTVIDSVSQLRTRGFVVLDHLVGSHEFTELKGKLDKKIEQEFDLNFPCLAQSKIDQDRDQDLIATSFLASTEELSKRGLTFLS